MALTEASLKQYIQDNLGVDTSALTADSPLFSAGVIDSFALVTMLTFIETEAGFRVRPDDVSLDNFDSLARILAYCSRRLAEPA